MLNKLKKIEFNKLFNNSSRNDNSDKFDPFADILSPLFVTIFFYTVIRVFLGEARYIPSGSMLPNLKINDRLLIEKVTFRQRNPKRGEIVVFNSPYSFDQKLISERENDLPQKWKCNLLTFPVFNFFTGFVDPACDAYIKRVVGISGDSVFIDRRGKVFIDKKLVFENYAPLYCKSDTLILNSCNSIQTVVPPNHVLVLGDNRANSWDSRSWPGGHMLPNKEIIGRAVWRFWPINRVGLLTPSSRRQLPSP